MKTTQRFQPTEEIMKNKTLKKKVWTKKNNNTKTKKTKKTKKNNLYKIYLPLKKDIFKTRFNRLLNKNRNTESNCSKLIISPFEKKFEKTHKELINLKLNSLLKIYDNLLDINKNIPKNINPKTDYYTYINYRWLKQQSKIMNETKTYFFKIDSFRVIQDSVYGEIKELIENYIQENKKERKVVNLNNFYNSLIYIDNYSGIQNGLNAIKKVDEYIKNDNLTLFLAYINSIEIISYKCPIFWNVQPDIHNSSIYSCNIDFPRLTFDNFNIYFLPENKLKQDKIYIEFIKFIDIIFTLYMGKNHGINPHYVFECEKDIITSLDCDNTSEEQTEPKRVNSKQSKDIGFDWYQFSNYLGYKKVPDNYLTYDVKYIQCIMKILNKEWKTIKWRAYWLYIFLLHTIRYSKNRDIFWKFVRNYLQGDQLLTPGTHSFIFGLSLGYNKLITELYCNKNPRIDELSYVKTLSNDLKNVLIRMIKNNDWLMPKTKMNALKKLYHLKFVYGTPEITIEDPDLEYDKENLWENLLKLSAYRVSIWVNLTGKNIVNISCVDWKEQELTGSQAYIVNAFYTPNRNDIFIPQAILQEPFLDLKQRGIEYNLAFMGFTLCHEMSHSLDNLGSMYDYKGNLKNWWSNEDKKIFNKKNQDIIKQYNLFSARDGIKLDASISAGEDLADINGCYILTEYLRDFQEKNHDTLYIRDLSFKAFFAYFSVQGRQTIYKQAIQANIETNPHPLEKYRVNCVLARNPIFKIIYNIKKNDPMYWKTNSFW